MQTNNNKHEQSTEPQPKLTILGILFEWVVLLANITTNTITTPTANATTTTRLCLKTLLQILPRSLPTLWTSDGIFIVSPSGKCATWACYPRLSSPLLCLHLVACSHDDVNFWVARSGVRFRFELYRNELARIVCPRPSHASL